MYQHNILLPTSSRLFWTQKADMRHYTAVDAHTNREPGLSHDVTGNSKLSNAKGGWYLSFLPVDQSLFVRFGVKSTM